MLLTAKAAVSWSTPTLTQPELAARSYTPYGTARPSSLIRKSWTRTSSGWPCGRYSRPLLRKSPTSSFFLVSTEITGCCSAKAAATWALIWANCIPVGVAVDLLGLAVALQAVTCRIEQFGHQGAAHLVALLLQRLGQSAHALAGPPQRRLRIPPRRRFDQRLEIGAQDRVPDNRGLASRAGSSNPSRWFVLGQFLQTPPDRARCYTGCHRHCGNPTITGSKR